MSFLNLQGIDNSHVIKNCFRTKQRRRRKKEKKGGRKKKKKKRGKSYVTFYEDNIIGKVREPKLRWK